MAESIKKFIIKDVHGGTKESGSFSVVGEVHVDIVPGYGEPYADSEYVNGILTITIHNIEGNGITDITTDSQEGDEAVNTVTIKTNANPEGVVLEVRNGSRGNGIASSSEVLSPEDGGTNTHTFTDDDGNEHVFHTKNGQTGKKGDQGDSAVYDPSAPDTPDFVMANTTGQSTTKAMTQKAVTDVFQRQSQIIGLTEDYEYPITDVPWAQGSMNLEDGSDITSSVTIRSGFIYADDDKINISCSEGYFIKSILAHNTASKSDVYEAVYFGNPSGTGFDTTMTSFDVWGRGKFYRCTIGKVSGSSIVPADASNVSIKSIEYVTKGVGGKVTFNDVAKRVSLLPLEETTAFYGSIGYWRGNIVPADSSQHTVYLKKYEISDNNKKYYADLRVYGGTNDVCGVAYFDSDEIYICAQFIANSSTISLRKARLNVPSGTKYIYILGADNEDTDGYVIPQLYVADELQSEAMEECGGIHLREVASFSMIGKDSTMVDSPNVPVRGNTRYVVKLSYDSWTLPDSAASTTAIKTGEHFGSTTTNNVGWFQNQLPDGMTEYEFITRTNSEWVNFSIRAVSGEVMSFSIYEVIGIEKIGESEIKGCPPLNTILYNVTKVNTLPFENVSGISSAVQGDEVDSAWAVVFPDTYSPTGKPTQVIAMLHGAEGIVTSSVMGYSTTNWIAWRNTYLSEGYAVLDVNGWGISTQSDEKSQHWGCPAALETLDKAFETLRSKYNVADKMLLHGTSMGGVTAWGYAFTYPNKVAALGLFAPSTLSWYIYRCQINQSAEKVTPPWQYTNITEAINDDFQRMVGFDPIFRCLRLHNGSVELFARLADNDVMEYGEASSEFSLVGQNLPCPVRIWHGTLDSTVPYKLSQIVTDAYRRLSQPVTLRLCPDGVHNLGTGNTQYVVDEAVEYFKRYG